MLFRKPNFYLNYMAAMVFVGFWAAWLALLVVSPFSISFEATTYSISLFCITQIAMLAGLSCGASPFSVEKQTQVSPRWYNALLFFSAVSVFSRLADYFVIRSVSAFECSSVTRAIVEAAGPNIFSAVSSLTLPAVFAAAAFAIFEIVSNQATPRYIAGVALMALSPLYALTFGGRFPVLIALAFIIAVVLLKKKPSLKLFAGIGVAVLLFFTFTMVMFLGRLNCMQPNINLAAFSSHTSVAQMLQPTPMAVAAINNSSSFVGPIIFYFVNLSQYVLHGVFEFFLLVKMHGDKALAWGRYEFFPLDRLLVLLAKFGIVAPPPDINLLNPKSGVYTTFWGPTYIDFGSGMPFFAFAFGLIVRFFERRYQAGDLFALPIYALFLVQIALIPITNGLTASGTLYANMGLVALWAVHQLSQGRRRNHVDRAAKSDTT